MNRRTFFGTTVGVLLAPMIPVKAKADTHNMFLPYPYYELSKRYELTRYRKGWEYYDGVTWVPINEKRCTIDRPFHKDTRHHYHPGGEENCTTWLEDPRYPTRICVNGEGAKIDWGNGV